MNRDLDSHDTKVVANYTDRAGADADDRQAAMFAACGNAEAEAVIQRVDEERAGAVLKTIAQAAERGLGWSGSPVDVAHLFRAIRAAGLWP